MSGGVFMQRKRVAKRGRLIPLLAALAFGYAAGAWHMAALRDVGHSSAAGVVADRFPQEWNAPPALTVAVATSLQADSDLFRPAAMVPPEQPSQFEQPTIATAAPPAGEQRVVQTASLESIAPPANAAASPPRSASGAVAKASAAPTHPAAANRNGYILDDAQIAGIKKRLHLTPDQERMWPAVEAALRNMAYKRTQQAAARGGGRNVQAAAVDPQAVEGLKSAAVPLIMSFSSEQKEEVRNLAHVMGLDQLASQF
jgi:hypothetical protein